MTNLKTKPELLRIRYQIQTDSYRKTGEDSDTVYGKSRISAAKEIDLRYQFAAVVITDAYSDFPKGSELACVNPGLLATTELDGATVLLEVPIEGSETMAEIKIAKAILDEDISVRFETLNDRHLIKTEGRVVGVVLGFFTPIR